MFNLELRSRRLSPRDLGVVEPLPSPPSGRWSSRPAGPRYARCGAGTRVRFVLVALAPLRCARVRVPSRPHLPGPSHPLHPVVRQGWRRRRAGQVRVVVQQRVRHVLLLLVVLSIRVFLPPRLERGVVLLRLGRPLRGRGRPGALALRDCRRRWLGGRGRGSFVPPRAVAGSRPSGSFTDAGRRRARARTSRGVAVPSTVTSARGGTRESSFVVVCERARPCRVGRRAPRVVPPSHPGRARDGRDGAGVEAPPPRPPLPSPRLRRRAPPAARAGRGASCVELLPARPSARKRRPSTAHPGSTPSPTSFRTPPTRFACPTPPQTPRTSASPSSRTTPAPLAAPRVASFNVEKLVLPASLLRSRASGSDPSPAVLVEARAAASIATDPPARFKSGVRHRPRTRRRSVGRRSAPIPPRRRARRRCVVAALALEPHARRPACSDAERAGTRKRR